VVNGWLVFENSDSVSGAVGVRKAIAASSEFGWTFILTFTT